MTDSGVLEAYLEDASGGRPGHAAGLLRPRHEGEIASFLRRTSGHGITILPQAARSSLTGGAIPHGEVVVSIESMAEIGPVRRFSGGGRIDVGPGVRLRDLLDDLARRGFYYPPAPTYQDAMVAGTISTNAGGAATFKYGVTRQWVQALRVLLFNGDLLEIERGQVVAPRRGQFVVRLSDDRELRVPVPGYSLPPVKKLSAGYHAADPLDLVDLFIGSEGTLGLISGATLELVPLPGAQVTGLTFLPGTAEALELTAALRSAACRARQGRDPSGPDIRAVEFVDGRSLDLLREHGEARRLRIAVPEDAGAALLFEIELPAPTSDDEAQRILGGFLEGGSTAERHPLTSLFRILMDHGVVETLELAFPEQRARAEALKEFREAVPKRVNELLSERRRRTPGVKKVGGDLIVPFDQLAEMMRVYEQGFSGRGLDFAIWGHVSDGNLHPNALPRTARETAAGLEALLEFADEAARRGGSPLSEHGVGRNPVKQEMLRRFLGTSAVASMRTVKAALDPELRFAPGVLFPVDDRAGELPGGHEAPVQ